MSGRSCCDKSGGVILGKAKHVGLCGKPLNALDQFFVLADASLRKTCLDFGSKRYARGLWAIEGKGKACQRKEPVHAVRRRNDTDTISNLHRFHIGMHKMQIDSGERQGDIGKLTVFKIVFRLLL